MEKKTEEFDYKSPVKVEEEEAYKNQEEGHWSGGPIDEEIIQKVQEQEEKEEKEVKKPKKTKKPKKPKLKEPVEIKAPEFTFQGFGKMREPIDEHEEQSDQKRQEGSNYEDSEQATEHRIVGEQPIGHRLMHPQSIQHRAIDEQPMEHREIGEEQQQGPTVHYEPGSSPPEAPTSDQLQEHREQGDEKNDGQFIPNADAIPSTEGSINSHFAGQSDQDSRFHPHVHFYEEKK